MNVCKKNVKGDMDNIDEEQVSRVTGSTFYVQILREDYLVTVGYILNKYAWKGNTIKKEKKDSAIVYASE